MNKIYLDYAATTPLHPEVLRAMMPYFTDSFGNPSSIYTYGREAKEAIENSRKQVAALLNARPDEIVFTGSGTEADNFALIGVAFANRYKGNHIITSKIEHHAVLETCKFLEEMGFEISYLPVDQYGQVMPEDVKKYINKKTLLVSIMYANNEIGTIEPVSDIARITAEAGVYLHTDAVQAIGHIPVDVAKLGIDLLSFSGHKLYGPKGIGALYIKNGTRVKPYIHGGSQEMDRRASTENVAGIVGLARACELAGVEMDEENKRMIPLRDKLSKSLMSNLDFCSLNGHPVQRLPNNVNISVKFIEGRAVCLYMDKEGICISAGSACSLTNKEPSHVLIAIGIPAQDAYGSLRFTLGKWTTAADIDRVIEVLPPIVEKIIDGKLSGHC